jgi:FkbM family methyltransferase
MKFRHRATEPQSHREGERERKSGVAALPSLSFSLYLSLRLRVYVAIQTFLARLRRHTLRERLQWRWKKLVRLSRLAWWRSQAGKQQVDVYIQEGSQIRLYPGSFLSQFIVCEEYEMSERSFLKDFLRPGDIFVDVGANIGLFTIIASRYVGARGHVYAFEPCAETHRRLLENVRLNGLMNVSCFQAALSDHYERLDMTVSLDGFDVCNSLAQPAFGRLFASESVDCVAWDEFASEHGIAGRVSMMKIDVEGWEAHVIDGAVRTFSREDAPILQVEFNDLTAMPAGSSGRKLYDALESLGYKMFTYDARNRTLIPEPPRDSYPLMNLIAAKRPDYIVARLMGDEK